MAQHVIFLSKAAGATMERADKVLAVLVARGNVLGEIALVRRGLQTVRVRAAE